jgi:hypothetical protein
MMDGHALAVSAATPGTIYLAVRMGMFRSADQGQSWQDMEPVRAASFDYPQSSCALCTSRSSALASPEASVVVRRLCVALNTQGI